MKPEVQSLWVGNRLSRMEHYSIKSFLNLGYKFVLYTYEPVANVPKGTIVKNGNTIIPKKENIPVMVTIPLAKKYNFFLFDPAINKEKTIIITELMSPLKIFPTTYEYINP